MANHLEGSSPLARGLLLTIKDIIVQRGIIPARAGFTPFRVWSLSLLLDHPRSRGVYYFADSNLQMAKGSSPLARGLLFARH